MADRTEKVSITRTHSASNVKVSILEDGINVSYSVKTYETEIGKSLITARKGAERFLLEAQEALTA